MRPPATKGGIVYWMSGCPDLALEPAHALLRLFRHFTAEVLLKADLVRKGLQENCRMFWTFAVLQVE